MKNSNLMIKEDHVSFEVAKLLKKKGFKEQCLAYYTKDAEFYYNACYGRDVDSAFKSFNSRSKYLCTHRIDAPTISQVLKWLREEKGVYVSIGVFPTFSTKNKVHFCYTIKTESDGSNMKVIESEYTYCEYSEAELNCIEYIIDNILQIKQQ